MVASVVLVAADVVVVAADVVLVTGCELVVVAAVVVVVAADVVVVSTTSSRHARVLRVSVAQQPLAQRRRSLATLLLLVYVNATNKTPCHSHGERRVPPSPTFTITHTKYHVSRVHARARASQSFSTASTSFDTSIDESVKTCVNRHNALT